jgi:hypothetical protein
MIKYVTISTVRWFNSGCRDHPHQARRCHQMAAHTEASTMLSEPLKEVLLNEIGYDTFLHAPACLLSAASGQPFSL